MTAEVLDGLGGVGIEVLDEVVPLAAGGTLVGGPRAGLPIVTKGGLVGDTGTAVVCLDALRRPRHRHRILLQHRTDSTHPTDRAHRTSEGSSMTAPVLALTPGDPVGIEPEITAAVLHEYSGDASVHGIAVADASVMRRAVEVLGLDAEVRAVSSWDVPHGGPGVIDVFEHR